MFKLNRNILRLYAVIFVVSCVAVDLVRAQQFTLAAPGLDFTSKAYLTEAKLDVIDSQGTVNSYVRDLSFDSADGKWIGYRNRDSGRILRWPSSNSGNLQIGDRQGGQMQYSTSKMQIREVPGQEPIRNPLLPPPQNKPVVPRGPQNPRDPFDAQINRGGGENFPEYQGREWRSFAKSDLFNRIVSNPIDRLPTAQPVHLVSYDANGAPWALSQRGTRLGCISQVNSNATWWVAPAGPGMVRLQLQSDGQVWAVSADDRNALRLSLVTQDPRQLWRVCNGPIQNAQYLLENAFFVGNFLTHTGLGNLGIQPMLGLPTQLWVPLAPPQNYIATLQPFWRNVNREIRPNPPLPPAEIELVNAHKNAVMILIGDLRSGQQIKELKIAANQSTTITVERDSGSTLVEVVEVMAPGGGWSRQEYVTPIPPVSLYDLSVYEEFLQSIAIDRTGKSPNVIEDVNYVPKSVGLLVLPPGEALPERGQMDVFGEARNANNAGAVRRMDPKRFEKPKIDPLESILEGIQKQNQPKVLPRKF
jgi:hypothetical protein